MEIYDMVDLVHAGIVMEHNCDVLLDCNNFNEDIEFLEPIIYKENGQIQMEKKKIFGVTFEPHKITILPNRIQIAEYSKDDIIKLPACCLYEKSKDNY